MLIAWMKFIFEKLWTLGDDPSGFPDAVADGPCDEDFEEK